jgi:hypothetical protein
MAGQSRTLKLSILADVDQLKKSLNTSTDDVGGFTNKLDGFGKMAGAAFASAGVAAVAYAGKLAIDGVKAAIEDEAAQVRLANALKNTVGATSGAIKSAEDWILKQSLATGIADDQYRPALERITRSTKNIEEAQKLTNLAADIAKAKNLDLATVANALAKANDGQTGALKKLGITLGDNATNLQEYNKVQKQLEKAQLDANFALEEYGPKSKEYIKASSKVAETQEKANTIASQGIDVFGELGKEFSGAAAESANTFQGKLDRLNIAFAEGKETIGAFILDAVTPLVGFIVDKIVPAISEFIGAVGGDEGLTNTFSVFIDGVKSFVLPILGSLKGVFDKIKGIVDENKDAFAALVTFLSKVVAPFLGGAFALAIKVLGVALGGILTVVSKIIDGFLAIINLGKKIGDALGGLFGNNSSNSSNSSNASFGASIPSSIVSNASKNKGGSPINITVNGAIDPIGTARTIVNLLNQEATLSGTFNRVGSSKLQSV